MIYEVIMQITGWEERESTQVSYTINAANKKELLRRLQEIINLLDKNKELK